MLNGQLLHAGQSHATQGRPLLTSTAQLKSAELFLACQGTAILHSMQGYLFRMFPQCASQDNAFRVTSASSCIFLEA